MAEILESVKLFARRRNSALSSKTARAKPKKKRKTKKKNNKKHTMSFHFLPLWGNMDLKWQTLNIISVTNTYTCIYLQHVIDDLCKDVTTVKYMLANVCPLQNKSYM